MPPKKKLLRRLLLFVLLCFPIVYYFTVTAPLVKKMCEEEGCRKVNDIINEANDVVLAKDFFYENYFTVEKDKDGYVTAIRINGGLVNQISMMWGTEIQNRLNELREQEFLLPAGVYTGNAFLSQFGSEISVRGQIICNCTTSYRSIFQTKGINQTLHRFVLSAEVSMDLIVPFSSSERVIKQDMILAENIISGKIPSTYIDGESGLDYLDLLE